MWSFQRALTLGLAVGALAALLLQMAGYDQMAGAGALYAAAFGAAGPSN